MELKTRSTVTVILLSVVTCGIYYLFWMYQTNKTINYLSGRESVGNGIVILSFFCGPVGWYIWHKWDQTLIETSRQRGIGYSGNFLMWVILSVVAGVGALVMTLQVQDVVNRLIEQNEYQNNGGGYAR
ncbi:hypothetical protein FACS1894133_4000 [Clostridia bacterium]|nr:hypothetical protein FACS1894133_4000 [Clostridia bacterium]